MPELRNVSTHRPCDLNGLPLVARVHWGPEYDGAFVDHAHESIGGERIEGEADLQVRSSYAARVPGVVCGGPVAHRALGLLAKLEPHLSSIAIAIESGGLAATLTRTIMNTMSFVTKRRFTRKAFDDVGSASEWLAERLEGGLSPADLVELVARARTATSPVDQSDTG